MIVYQRQEREPSVPHDKIKDPCIVAMVGKSNITKKQTCGVIQEGIRPCRTCLTRVVYQNFAITTLSKQQCQGSSHVVAWVKP